MKSWIDFLSVFIALSCLLIVSSTFIGIQLKRRQAGSPIVVLNKSLFNWQFGVGITWGLLSVGCLVYYINHRNLHELAILLINSAVSIIHIYMAIIKREISEIGISSPDGFFIWKDIQSYSWKKRKAPVLLMKVRNRITFFYVSRTIELDVHPSQISKVDELLQKYLRSEGENLAGNKV